MQLPVMLCIDSWRFNEEWLYVYCPCGNLKWNTLLKITPEGSLLISGDTCQTKGLSGLNNDRVEVCWLTSLCREGQNKGRCFGVSVLFSSTAVVLQICISTFVLYRRQWVVLAISSKGISGVCPCVCACVCEHVCVKKELGMKPGGSMEDRRAVWTAWRASQQQHAPNLNVPET